MKVETTYLYLKRKKIQAKKGMITIKKERISLILGHAQ